MILSVRTEKMVLRDTGVRSSGFSTQLLTQPTALARAFHSAEKVFFTFVALGQFFFFLRDLSLFETTEQGQKSITYMASTLMFYTIQLKKKKTFNIMWHNKKNSINHHNVTRLFSSDFYFSKCVHLIWALFVLESQSKQNEGNTSKAHHCHL